MALLKLLKVLGSCWVGRWTGAKGPLFTLIYIPAKLRYLSPSAARICYMHGNSVATEARSVVSSSALSPHVSILADVICVASPSTMPPGCVAVTILTLFLPFPYLLRVVESRCWN